MILWSIIACLILLVTLRKFHQNYSQLKFKYKLYELRDRVRRLKLEGKFDGKSDWLFDYYDQSFSKSISRSYFVTLYSLIIFSMRHGGDTQLKAFNKALYEEIEDSEDLQLLSKEYVDAVEYYVFDQHYISYKFVMRPILSLLLGAKKMSEIISGVLTYPEVTVSNKYQLAEIGVQYPNTKLESK